mmetsp:Transcript_83802/g.242013  ORF Transcript_83802/g.242013 Transcript_83802/m.242013 type:complete len:82 (-) Transcript_83802:2083-2328(-)
MLFHVFTHVKTDKRIFVIEHKLTQSLAELCFSNSRRPQEDKRGNRLGWIVEASTRTLNCFSHHFNRFILTNDSLAEIFCHV